MLTKASQKFPDLLLGEVVAGMSSAALDSAARRLELLEFLVALLNKAAGSAAFGTLAGSLVETLLIWDDGLSNSTDPLCPEPARDVLRKIRGDVGSGAVVGLGPAGSASAVRRAVLGCGRLCLLPPATTAQGANSPTAIASSECWKQVLTCLTSHLEESISPALVVSRDQVKHYSRTSAQLWTRNSPFHSKLVRSRQFHPEYSILPQVVSTLLRRRPLVYDHETDLADAILQHHGHHPLSALRCCLALQFDDVWAKSLQKAWLPPPDLGPVKGVKGLTLPWLLVASGGGALAVGTRWHVECVNLLAAEDRNNASTTRIWNHDHALAPSVPLFAGSLVCGGRPLEAGAVLCDALDVHPDLRTADGAMALLEDLFARDVPIAFAESGEHSSWTGEESWPRLSAAVLDKVGKLRAG